MNIGIRTHEEKTLPEYIKINISTNLNDLKNVMIKVKNNHNRYLNDHTLKVQDLYQNCYKEQEKLRINIYNKDQKYLVNTNVLTPRGFGIIDITIKNFLEVINNKKDSIGNQKLGKTWHEQLNNVFAKLKSEFDHFFATYEQVFSLPPSNFSFDEKLVNFFTIDEEDPMTELNNINFCTLPPLREHDKSLTLTPAQINELCPLDVYSTVETATMKADWQQIQNILINNHDNNNFITPYPLAIKHQSLLNNNSITTSNIGSNETNYGLLMMRILFFALPLVVICLFIKKILNCYCNDRKNPIFNSNNGENVTMLPQVTNHKENSNINKNESQVLLDITTINKFAPIVNTDANNKKYFWAK